MRAEIGNALDRAHKAWLTDKDEAKLRRTLLKVLIRLDSLSR